MSTFDYVIVGGGSAGCALAARLSADPRRSVLLLEAGGAGRHPWLRIPIGYGKVFYDARFNWKYTAEPCAGLNGRATYWPRGKCLGGSSAINAMVWVRGHRADYDDWGAAATGWGWHDVAPLFHRIEAWKGAPGNGRGMEGAVAVCDMAAEVHPLSRAYVAAAQQVGIPTNPDYNAGDPEGAFYYQITTRDGLRSSTAEAYLEPIGNRPNLKIETGAQATRILFDGRRAQGIAYAQHGNNRVAQARAEVILCAGALNTPQLLQLSGVGPGALLQRMGIDPVVDAPGVGQNLMDHLGVDHLFTAQVPSLNQVLRPWLGKVKAALAYGLRRAGPLAMSLNQGGGFVRLKEGDGSPDLQLYFSPLTYTRAPAGQRPLLTPDPFPAYRLGFSPCKPTSRGSLELASPDPFAAPVMHPGYLSTQEDCAMMVAGSRLMRRIAAAPALAAVTQEEKIPGLSCQSDAALLENARNDAWTVFHQCGTARMGNDAGSVVDPALRVRGVSGLRVADASVFPTIPSGNTNAPAIMVGEKAADLIAAGAAQEVAA